jgi:hypothetical protein
MRTLAAALTTAQQSATNEPRVAIVAENLVAALRRLDFVWLDTTAETIAKHDVCVAADNSVTRVRADGAGNLFQQRLTAPATGDWTAWNAFGTGKGNVIACGAGGTRVVIVYTDAAGTGIKFRESTDSGATFSAEAAVSTAAAAVVDLSIAYKAAAGDCGLAYVTAAALALVKRTAGTWGAASVSAATFSSLNGVAVAYSGDYNIALTGVEVTTLRRTLWTNAYGDGYELTAGTWGTIYVQQQAESDSSVAYSAPFIAYADTIRITYVEADTFTGGNTRTYRTALHPLATFNADAYTYTSPVPVGYLGAEGLAIACNAPAADYFYETAPDHVYRAPLTPVTATLTADVVAVLIRERDASTTGYIDLDNSGGAYVGPPQPIALGNKLDVRWGYYTTSGYLTSKMQDLWIEAYEYRRSGGKSVLRLHVEGAWELLRRNRQRTQIVHNATDTYYNVIRLALARAGLRITSGGVSTRANAVAPRLTIHSTTSGYEAIRQALSYITDRLRPDTIASVKMLDPTSGAATTYTFGAAHALRSIQFRTEQPRAAEAHAFGVAAFGEAIDYNAAAVAGAPRDQLRDATSTTGATAAATATAHLRRRALDADAGLITVPPNCGQELYDMIEFSDATISAGNVKRRVKGIDWRYERRGGAVYEQTLLLGPI